MCLVGGVDVKEDLERLKKNPVIIVGTPARIKSFIDHRSIHFNKVNTFVVDEADKLIGEQTFEADLRFLIQSCPADVQKCLFSATFPKSVETFCNELMNNPEMVNCMTTSLTLQGVTQYIANVREEKYKVMLVNALFKKLQIN